MTHSATTFPAASAHDRLGSFLASLCGAVQRSSAVAARRRFSTSGIRAGILLVLLAICTTSQAQPLTWTGAGDGSTFGQAANWSPPSTPGSTNNCFIPAGAGNINVVSSATILSLDTASSLTIGSCATLTIN
ncbi:MAG: hypothetical protein KF859_13375, partial [Phycisphaeraceae bacterium]|nr:hypothetical protein [Phycisphaeraceae bacterium]